MATVKMTTLEDSQKEFKEKEEEYKSSLLITIQLLLLDLNEDTRIKLNDTDSIEGLGGFPYTDVLFEIDTNGTGVLYSSTDMTDVSFEDNFYIGSCNVYQLEKILQSVNQYVSQLERVK